MTSESASRRPDSSLLPTGGLWQLIERLYPICRSITGEGNRRTLRVLAEYLPVEIKEIPSGTRVFDWEIPLEWNIEGAYIRDPQGRVIVDFRDHNLHVMSYSTPIAERMSLDELRSHLYSLPDLPDVIPYRTSYYKAEWGFCLPHRTLEGLRPGQYEVRIDSRLEPGALTYGEYVFPGKTPYEVLLFAHICHPSLCNDNLSGIAVATFLAQYVARQERRFTYRFVFAPGTIGSIAWLSLNQTKLMRIRHGLVLALLGDRGPFTYKKTRDGVSKIDQYVRHVLGNSDEDYRITDFSPYGYDERQFNSPGIRLPVGRLTRTPNGEYPEYHTSADNLEFIDETYLAESLGVCQQIVDIIEADVSPINLSPTCEPQLGRRGLYSSRGGKRDIGVLQHALLWVLNQADGANSLVDIAERSGIAFAVVREAADELFKAGLLSEDGVTSRSGGL